MQYVEKGKPFTLDQLAKFVEQARGLEIPGDTIVSVRMSFGGQLQEIRVDTAKRHTGEPRE